ncbi:hypothetical protein FACS1894169_00990 [Bacteroidia bacterium]|nr:hypothetical protein FACS1894169_00990 [Bacteroidia bacterium]
MQKKRTKSELDRLREIAEESFIILGKTGREIAELHDISEQTVSNWRKAGNWDDRKRDMQLTPVKLKETLMREANNIAEGNEPKIKADSLSKIMAAITALEKSVNPRTVMSVFQMFDNFMADTNPAKAVEFTEYHKMFLQHLIALES